MAENGSERIPFDASGTFSITHLVEIVFHESLSSLMTLVLSDSSQELFYPFFPWIVKEITRISFFDNDASIHKNNPGGHIPGKPDLVCYHDHSNPIRRNLFNCVQYFSNKLR